MEFNRYTLFLVAGVCFQRAWHSNYHDFDLSLPIFDPSTNHQGRGVPDC
jgi:hypothetical protein